MDWNTRSDLRHEELAASSEREREQIIWDWELDPLRWQMDPETWPDQLFGERTPKEPPYAHPHPFTDPTMLWADAWYPEWETDDRYGWTPPNERFGSRIGSLVSIMHRCWIKDGDPRALEVDLRDYETTDEDGEVEIRESIPTHAEPLRLPPGMEWEGAEVMTMPQLREQVLEEGRRLSMAELMQYARAWEKVTVMMEEVTAFLATKGELTEQEKQAVPEARAWVTFFTAVAQKLWTEAEKVGEMRPIVGITSSTHWPDPYAPPLIPRGPLVPAVRPQPQEQPAL